MYRDLDFEDMQPNGLKINQELYIALENAFREDCAMLKHSGSTNYSLLLGIHYVRDGEPFDETLIFQSDRIVV